MLYISDKVISFSLKVNGKSKRFSFDSRMRGGSYLVVTSKDEIKALESSDMFNRIYRRGEESVEAPKRSRAKAKEPKAITEVETWQDAQSYLAENYSVDMNQLQTPSDILSAASANNIIFPNLQ
jgi:hypothetical protein